MVFNKQQSNDSKLIRTIMGKGSYSFHLESQSWTHRQLRTIGVCNRQHPCKSQIWTNSLWGKGNHVLNELHFPFDF